MQSKAVASHVTVLHVLCSVKCKQGGFCSLTFALKAVPPSLLFSDVGTIQIIYLSRSKTYHSIKILKSLQMCNMKQTSQIIKLY